MALTRPGQQMVRSHTNTARARSLRPLDDPPGGTSPEASRHRPRSVTQPNTEAPFHPQRTGLWWLFGFEGELIAG